MLTNKILITGSEGLVGSRFQEISGHGAILHTPKLVEFNITSKSEVKAILSSYEFSHIINFAAYTNVGLAENERGDKSRDCWQINVEGVKNLADAVKENGKTKLIHISTDMVFSGSGADRGPYAEKHLPGKSSEDLTWYGYTKAEGERSVRQILGDEATILRIIYPVRAKFDGKADYLRKPLQLFDENKLYPVFSDQIISVSFIDEVCFALDKIIDGGKTGTFHAASSDTTTPFALISYLLEKTRGKDAVKKLKSIKLEEFLLKNGEPSYRYPKYGGLKVEETERALGIKFSSWKKIVDQLIEQGLGK